MNRGSGRGSSNGYSGNRGRGNYQNGRGGGSKCMSILYFLDLMYRSVLCNVSNNIHILFYFFCDISIKELIWCSCYSTYVSPY